MTNTEAAKPPARRGALNVFELDQLRANAYAESGYWPDAKSQAQALVKIEAGRALGLAPIVAMSEVHVIQGKPTLGAGALATLVKTSGRYDYRIVEHTEERCVIRFLELDGDVVLGESVFTLDDARKAGLAGKDTWRKYPRNMLFARALSNGVAWFCPNVSAGRVYTPEELDGAADVIEGDAVEEPDEPRAESNLRTSPAAPAEAKPEQLAELKRLIARLTELRPGIDWRERAREIAGTEANLLTVTSAAVLIEKLAAKVETIEQLPPDQASA